MADSPRYMPIGDYGLRIKGIGRHLRSYAVLYAIDGAFPH